MVIGITRKVGLQSSWETVFSTNGAAHKMYPSEKRKDDLYTSDQYSETIPRYQINLSAS